MGLLYLAKCNGVLCVCAFRYATLDVSDRCFYESEIMRFGLRDAFLW